MIPGKLNSREMRRMMAQMGIKTVEMNDVKRVTLHGDSKDYIISNAHVVLIEARGEKSFQITGDLKEIPKSSARTDEPVFPDEDVKLVMEQAGVSREKAVEALKKAEGEVAQAIVDHKKKK